MLRFLIRISLLARRIRNKILYSVRPALHPAKLFPTEIRKLLNEMRLEVVDVGGAVDLQPHWYKMVGGAAQFTIFEPHPESYAAITKKYASYVEDGLFRILPIGLSGSGGPRTLFMTNAPTGSSIIRFNQKSPFLNENDGYFFPLRELLIETETLEISLAKARIACTDLIKLDIQGAELEVLKGLGTERIDRLLAVEMEVHLQDFYVDGAKLSEVARFIDENGFEFLDFRVGRDYAQRHGKTEVIKRDLSIGGWKPSISAKAWEADVVFFRKPDRLLKARDAPAIRRLIACYCVYNFFLEAFGLAREAAECGIFSEAEKLSILDGIREMVSCLDRDLGAYARIVHGLGDRNWGQYMWMGYPST